MGKLLIEAPDDVFVTAIVADGPVVGSQVLITLRSPRLERMQSSLIALNEHIAIIERPIADGRLDQEIATMGAKTAALSQAADLTAAIVVIVQQQFLVGQVGQKEVDQANVDAIQAKTAFLDSELSSTHAELKKNDMIDKIASAKNKLIRESTYLETMNGCLSIIAPVSGTFTASSGSGFFLKKGEIIAELDT